MITTTRYLWCGATACQTRDGNDNPLRRDMAEGEVNLLNDMQPLVYMPDQLGSVRDVLDGGTGNLLDSFDYTPYGSVARSSGTVPMDYHFAGLFQHPASALNLSATRPMDGVTGRWLDKDPIREVGGINLYGYVGANTTNGIDPSGWITINEQIPSEINGSTPCPVNEDTVKSSCFRHEWKEASLIDEWYFHGNMRIYKEQVPSDQWGSECAYRNGKLVVNDPHSGTANFYPDWTWRHFMIDPGGPRWDPWYDNYWATHPHPPGLE